VFLHHWQLIRNCRSHYKNLPPSEPLCRLLCWVSSWSHLFLNTCHTFSNYLFTLLSSVWTRLSLGRNFSCFLFPKYSSQYVESITQIFNEINNLSGGFSFARFNNKLEKVIEVDTHHCILETFVFLMKDQL
jgi:hypothetical protein